MFDWIDEGKLFISNPDADGNETYFYVKELRFYNKSIMMVGAEAPTLEELCDNLYEDYYVGVPLHENDDDDYFEIIDEDGYINRFEADNELKLEFEEGKIYGCPDSELSEEMFCKILSISPFRGKYAVIYVIGRSLSEIKYAEDHQDYENDVLEDLSVLPWEYRDYDGEMLYGDFLSFCQYAPEDIDFDDDYEDENEVNYSDYYVDENDLELQEDRDAEDSNNNYDEKGTKQENENREDPNKIPIR